MSDKRLLRIVAGMFFCITGSIIAYIVAGMTVYFLLACIFVIFACSIVVGVANDRAERNVSYENEC